MHDSDVKEKREYKPRNGHFKKDRHQADNDNFDGESEGFADGISDVDKDRRMFSRKKNCWFCAKDASPDWKNPHSYSWLVNEFGKISPARVSGLCSKHQRHATTAIKRGRNIGVLSIVSNKTLV